MTYVTPPGLDEREIAYPNIYTEEQVEQMKQRGLKFINWNDFAMLTGPGFTTTFLDDIKTRLNNNRSAIIIVVGPPGEGKTYLAIRLGEMLDKNFDITRQMCFTRIHILKILSDEIPLKSGQALLMDEGHLSAGARSWGKQDQQDLVNLLATARSKGFLIVIIALHKNMLDLIIRKYMGSYMIGLEKPGLGTPYRLFIPRFESEVWKNKYDPLEIALPDAERCDAPDCLACDFLRKKGKCMTSRAVYERLKKTYLVGLSKLAGDRIEEQSKKLSTPRRGELEKIIYADHKDKIKYNNRGKINFKCVVRIVDSLGWSVGKSTAELIADSLYENHEDLRPE